MIQQFLILATVLNYKKIKIKTAEDAKDARVFALVFCISLRCPTG
jgi:hypothetical protein